MAIKPLRFTLDTINSNYSSVGTVKQNDSAIFYITVTENNIAKDLTGQTIELFVMKPDKKPVRQTEDIRITNASKGELTIKVKTSAFQYPGNPLAELELTGSDGSISSSTFTFKVDPKVGSNEAIESTDDVQLFREIQKELEEFKNSVKNINKEESKRVEAENTRKVQEETRVASENERKLTFAEWTDKIMNTVNTVSDVDISKKSYYDGIVHNSLAGRIHHDVNRINDKLIDNSYLPYSGSYITANNSLEGYTRNTVLKGRTWQNLRDMSDAQYNQSSRTFVKKDHISRSFRLQGIVKPNTKYTVVYTITDLNLDGVNSVSMYTQNLFNNISVKINTITANGKYLFTIDSDATLPIVTFGELKGVGTEWENSVDGTNRTLTISDVMIFEGEYTLDQLPTQYFKGIKHTGWKEDSRNLNSSKMELGGLEWATGNLASITDRHRSVDFIKISPNTQIITNIKGQQGIIEYDINKAFVKGNVGAKGLTTTSNTEYIKVTSQDNLDCIQINRGSTLYQYEPYHPEPTKIEVVSHGKNLAYRDDTYFLGGSKVTTTKNADGSITITRVNGSMGVSYGIVRFRGKLKKNNRYIHSVNVIEGILGRIAFYKQDDPYSIGTRTESSFNRNPCPYDVEYFDILFYVTEENPVLTIKDIQLEEIPTSTSPSTPYEPYTEDRQELYLNEEFGSLPNGVANEIKRINGRLFLEKNMIKVILNENSPIKLYANYNGEKTVWFASEFLGVYNQGGSTAVNLFHCDKLPFQQMNFQKQYDFPSVCNRESGSENRVVFRLWKSDVGFVEGDNSPTITEKITRYLKNNPITIYAPCNPILIPLDTTNQAPVMLPNNIMDEYIPLENGKVKWIKKVGEYTFNGREELRVLSSANPNTVKADARSIINLLKAKTASILVATKLTVIRNDDSDTPHIRIDGSTPYGSPIMYIDKKDLSGYNPTDIQQLLAKWYAEDDPLKIWYELADYEEYIIDSKDAPTTMRFRCEEGITYLYSANYIQADMSVEIPSNVQAIIQTYKAENKELNNELDKTNTNVVVLQKENVDLLASNFDLDFRVFEIECVIEDSMLVKQGGIKMARTQYEQAKKLILLGEYERADMEYKLTKYRDRGVITEEQFNELVYLMDSDEMTNAPLEPPIEDKPTILPVD